MIHILIQQRLKLFRSNADQQLNDSFTHYKTSNYQAPYLGKVRVDVWIAPFGCVSWMVKSNRRLKDCLRCYLRICYPKLVIGNTTLDDRSDLAYQFINVSLNYSSRLLSDRRIGCKQLWLVQDFLTFQRHDLLKPSVQAFNGGTLFFGDRCQRCGNPMQPPFCYRIAQGFEIFLKQYCRDLRDRLLLFFDQIREFY